MQDQQQKTGFGSTPLLIGALLVMIAWYQFVVMPYSKWRYGDEQETGQEQAQQVREESPPLADEAVIAPAIDESEVQGDRKAVTVETDEIVFELDSLGAGVSRATFRDFFSSPHDEDKLSILMPLRGDGGDAFSFVMRPAEGADRTIPDLTARVWRLVEDSGEFDAEGRRTVTFATAHEGVEYVRTYVFHREGFTFDMDLHIRNRSDQTISGLRFDMVGPNGVVPDDLVGGRRYDGMIAVLAGRRAPEAGLKLDAVSQKTALDPDRAARSLSMQVNEWAAVKNRYFAAMMQAEGAKQVISFYAEPVEPAAHLAGNDYLSQPNVAAVARIAVGDLAPGGAESVSFKGYLGPMESGVLRDAGGSRGWEQIVDFGFFGWLGRILLMLLNVLHVFTGVFGSFIGGYGLAILLLTVLVKGAIFPLQRKGMISMQKMQRLQPEIAAIKKRYEKDTSREAQMRVQRETMELYKKNNVSLLGGCLPMLVQLPMFIALYGMLRTAFELRHERFLWIRDLSHPEAIFDFGFTIPIIGWSALNILPIIYLGLTLVSMRFQPTPADPQAAQQQKMMKYMMVFIFFLFYNMPSGLVLYFVFSNALGILEQWNIRRHMDAIPVVSSAGVLVDPATASDRKTAWDRQEEQKAREADKRKRRNERRRT